MKEITLIGFAQALFFAIIVILKKDKGLKDYFLSLFFFLVGAELIFQHFYYKSSSVYSSSLIIFDFVYWILLGPSIYFYIQTVINKNMKLAYKHLLHLTPFVLCNIALAHYLTSNKYNSFGDFYLNSTGIFRFILIIIWEYTTPVYLLISLIVLWKHQKRIKNYFSNVEKKDLKWLFFLSIGLTIYIYSTFIYWWISMIITNVEVPTVFSNIFLIILVLYVFLVGIFGYRQEGIFYENKIVDYPNEPKKSTKNQNKKYERTGLDQDEKTKLKNELEKLMLDKKPYLNNNLTIAELAGLLDTTLHKLSQVINEGYSKNFFDFINSYRVKEVKEKLLNSENNIFKIESIAYDCGFNSKSSFYAIFKKHAQLTPKEFKLSHSEKTIKKYPSK